MDQQTEKERYQLVADLAMMKHRAGKLGMWRTMQTLDAATSTAGFELADLLTGEQADTVRSIG